MYSHSQFGEVTSFTIGGAAVLIAIISIITEQFMYSIIVAALVLITLLFYELTVKVNDNQIRVIYGIGVISFRFRLSEIESCKIVRNSWWYGFGIRLTPHGWLLNVSGLDAVEIKYRNRNKKVRIGTDDAINLKASIDKVIK